MVLGLLLQILTTFLHGQILLPDLIQVDKREIIDQLGRELRQKYLNNNTRSTFKN